MSADHLSSVPAFTTGAVTWRCWITDGGQRYEWRSTCGKFRAGRALAFCWARSGDRIVGKAYKTLSDAMHAVLGNR